MASWTRDDYQALQDQLEVEIADLRQVIDVTIAGLRYASTDVAMAYARAASPTRQHRATSPNYNAAANCARYLRITR